MIKFSQHSFSGGQIDRDLMGRQDLAKYFTGASTLKNFVVKKQGFLAKRRGTNLVCDLSALTELAENAYKTRLIPFCYEKTGGFLLLFVAEKSASKSKIYVCSGSGVLFADGVWRTSAENVTSETGETVAPVTIDVPYIGSELDSIGYAQSGDTLYIAHPGYPFATIKRQDKTFTYTAINFKRQGASQTVYPPTIVGEKSGTEGGGATRDVSYVATYVKDGVESEPSTPFYISYKLPWASTFRVKLTCGKGANETEPDYYNVYKKSGGDYGFIGKTGDATKTIEPEVSDWGDTVVGFPELNYWVSSVSEVYWTGKIVSTDRTGSTSDNVKADFMKGGFLSETGYYYNDVTTYLGGASSSSASSGITLTFKDGFFCTRLDMFLGILGVTYMKAPHPEYVAAVVYSKEFTGVALKVVATYTNGGTGTANTKSFTWQGTVEKREDKKLYAGGTYDSRGDVQKSFDAALQKRQISADFSAQLSSSTGFPSGGAWLKSLVITAYDDATMKVGAIPYISGIKCYETDKDSTYVYDDYITPDVSLTPPKNEEHFEAENKYPSCVCLHTQRLALANTHQQPFTLFLSTSGDLYNFNTHDSVREDDAIEATIPATEFPEINHLVAAKDLVVLCDNGEWVVSPSTGNTLSLKTIQIKKQSHVGCSKRLQPLNIGEEIILAEATSETLRAMRYNWTVDGYETQDLSVLAADITRQNPIIDFAYKQHPDSLVICVLQNGTLGVLAYMKEQELCAWSVCELGGGLKVVGVASDKSIVNGTTGTYLLAKDENRGKLLLLRIRDDVDASTIEKAVCLDAMSIVETEPEPTPEETDETEEGTEDEDAETDPEPIVVPEGKCAIDLLSGKEFWEGETLEAGRKYAVGYRFEALFRSIHPEMQSEQTMQFELKGLKNLELRLAEAGSCEIVQTELETAPMNQWVSVPTELKPGENGEIDLPQKTIVVDAAQRADSDGRISIRSRSAYPLHVLSFSANYEFDPRLMGQRG